MKELRKTIKIYDLKEKINERLKLEDVSDDVKAELCILLETILMETRNYRGFKYYDWVMGGWVRWVDAGKPEDKSEFIGREHSRIYY